MDLREKVFSIYEDGLLEIIKKYKIDKKDISAIVRNRKMFK